MVDIVLAATLGCFGDFLSGLAFGTDEKYPPAAGDDVAHRRHRPIQHGHRLLQIDDMDAVAGPKQVGGHFRVPTPGVMSEMDASLQELAHSKGGKCHRLDSFSGCSSAGTLRA